METKFVVGLKELRERMETYITQVRKGRSFVVMRRSRPIFKISPFSEEDERWEMIVDFTKVKRGGISIDELLSRL